MRSRGSKNCVSVSSSFGVRASVRARQGVTERERAHTCQSAAVRDRSLCLCAVKRALPDLGSSTAPNGKTPKGK